MQRNESSSSGFDARAGLASALIATPSGHRLNHLDGLRGIAALLVMIQHSVTVMARHPEAAGWFQWFAHAFNTSYFSPGRAGIVAFFLISGFVVPFSLKSPHALKGFAVSRFFRLYPAYWSSLFLAVVLLSGLGIESFETKQVLANITMFQFLLGQDDVVGAYWTLFLEMVFYIACATWFMLGVMRSARFQFAVVLALLVSGITGLFVGYALFFYTLLRKAFVSKITLFLGGISYSFYLLHGITLELARWLAYDWPWSVGAPFIFLFCLFGTLVIAVWIYNWVEQPLVKVSHRIMSNLRTLPERERSMARGDGVDPRPLRLARIAASLRRRKDLLRRHR